MHTIQVESTSTSEELSSVLNGNDEILFRNGYSKPTASVSLSDKEEILKTVWLHYVFLCLMQN